jgi:hypothetical protein
MDSSLSSLASAILISTFPTSSNSLASVEADILTVAEIARNTHYALIQNEGGIKGKMIAEKQVNEKDITNIWCLPWIYDAGGFVSCLPCRRQFVISVGAGKKCLSVPQNKGSDLKAKQCDRRSVPIYLTVLLLFIDVLQQSSIMKMQKLLRK